MPVAPIARAVASRALAPRRTPPPRVAAGGGRRVDHSRLQRVVERVSDGWRVDYAAVARSSELAAYRRELALTEPATLGREEQLAFWVNAYNATVLGLVAARMPVRSVLDIPGALDQLRFPVGRAHLTLDEIEHGKVRRLGEPRAHFGMNCGAVGCPPLAVYAGADVRAALAANGRRYLSDEARGARADGDRVLLTRILQWFAGDFAPVRGAPRAVATLVGLARPARVLPAVRPLLPPGLRGARAAGFLPYDWSVNGG